MQYRYYYRITFPLNPQARVSQYFDAGPSGSVGDLKVLSGTLAAGLPAAPAAHEDKEFLGSEILATLNAIKAALTVDGARGERLLAKDGTISVPRATPVHVRYDVMTIAEEALQGAFFGLGGFIEIPDACGPSGGPHCH